MRPQRSRGPLPSAPKMPKKNRARTIRDSTESTSGPVLKITNSVRNASRAVKTSAMPTTSVRIGLEAGLRELLPALALVGEQLDREQPEGEAADVREVRHAAAALADGVEVEIAEEHLLQEPDSEDQQRRQLEDREEEHDEDHGHDPGAREEQDVAAENAGDRARGADVGHLRVGPDEDLQPRRGEAAEQVEGDELDAPHGVLDVVAEDPQEQHIAPEVQQAAVHEHRREQREDRGGGRLRAARVAHLGARVRDLVRDLRVVDDVAEVVLAAR